MIHKKSTSPSLGLAFGLIKDSRFGAMKTGFPSHTLVCLKLSYNENALHEDRVTMENIQGCKTSEVNTIMEELSEDADTKSAE